MEFNVTHRESLGMVVFPYIQEKKRVLGLPDDQKAMLIFDVFKGQKTQRVTDLIEENCCVWVYVLPNLTHVFQPLDLTVNCIAK